MPLNPLDYLKSLHLFDSQAQTPDQIKEQDDQATAAQANDPSWMKMGRSAVDGLVGGVKGVLGIDDGIPSSQGWNMNHAAQLGMGVLPLLPGGKMAAGLKGMYSRVERTAEALPEALHPVKAEGIFRNNAAKEEIDYRGLGDFLKGNQTPKVTKTAIQDHLAANPMPEIGVKDLGGPRAAPLPDGAGGLVYQQGNQPTKYERSSLNVPGGENYRERLLTLPTKEWSSADPASMERAAAAPEYQSSHWDEPNVLAHSRFDERNLPKDIPSSQAAYDTLAAVPESARTAEQWQQFHQEKNRLYGNEPGEKGRFIQEVQSDWHQAGKEHGYASDQPTFTDADHADAFNARDALQNELLHRHQANLPDDFPLHAPTRRAIDALRMAGAAPEDIARLEQAQAHLEHVHAVRGGMRDGAVVPDAPFKESWPDLVLKQHVMDVAEKPDLNWLGFTTGDTQNQRYDLSKQIAKVEWEPHDSRHFPDKTAASGNGLLWAYDKEGQPVMPGKAMHQSEVGDHIGHEVAARLFGGENAERLAAGVGPYLEGLDLQTGGAGMKHFYDQKLPSALRKILTPFGGKVELGEVPIGPAPFSTGTVVGHRPNGVGPAEGYVGQVNRGTEHIASTLPINNRVDAQERLAELHQLIASQPTPMKTVPAWIAHLPPEMKKAILEKGLPLLTLMGLMQPGSTDSAPQSDVMKGLQSAR